MILHWLIHDAMYDPTLSADTRVYDHLTLRFHLDSQHPSRFLGWLPSLIEAECQQTVLQEEQNGNH